jgi:hypothetical protein
MILQKMDTIEEEQQTQNPDLSEEEEEEEEDNGLRFCINPSSIKRAKADLQSFLAIKPDAFRFITHSPYGGPSKDTFDKHLDLQDSQNKTIESLKREIESLKNSNEQYRDAHKRVAELEEEDAKIKLNSAKRQKVIEKKRARMIENVRIMKKAFSNIEHDLADDDESAECAEERESKPPYANRTEKRKIVRWLESPFSTSGIPSPPSLDSSVSPPPLSLNGVVKARKLPPKPASKCPPTRNKMSFKVHDEPK